MNYEQEEQYSGLSVEVRAAVHRVIDGTDEWPIVHQEMFAGEDYKEARANAEDWFNANYDADCFHLSFPS